MTEYNHEMKIPKERIAVLIGKKGAIKAEIEEDLECTIDVNSKDGDVSITGEDSLNIFVAKDIIRAIGRGFNPDVARFLLKPDYSFELIPLHDYIGKSKKKAIRLKSRVIGTDGKSRINIERYTETNIVIYGKTIGIIGEIENTLIAKRAVEKLLSGSPHSNVFKWLEQKQRDRKRKEAIEKMGIE